VRSCCGADFAAARLLAWASPSDGLGSVETVAPGGAVHVSGAGGSGRGTAGKPTHHGEAALPPDPLGQFDRTFLPDRSHGRLESAPEASRRASWTRPDGLSPGAFGTSSLGGVPQPWLWGNDAESGALWRLAFCERAVAGSCQGLGRCAPRVSAEVACPNRTTLGTCGATTEATAVFQRREA
jgi:hypothetical protein